MILLFMKYDLSVEKELDKHLHLILLFEYLLKLKFPLQVYICICNDEMKCISHVDAQMYIHIKNALHSLFVIP